MPNSMVALLLQASVAARRIEQIARCLAVAPGAQIGEEQIQAARIVGVRIVDGSMRAYDQIASMPKAVPLRDRLRCEHVEYSARQVPLVQHVAQCVLIEEGTTTDVHHTGA